MMRISNRLLNKKSVLKLYGMMLFALISLIILGFNFIDAKETKKMTENTTNASTNPQVLLETSMGNIVIELYKDKAPKTAANFLHYVNSHFYDGTLFHRVISNFMIQGGGFTKGMVEKPNESPIENEATNGLSNLRGTIAMARTQVVNSATSQFFINVVDNTFLNHKDNTTNGFGYCVFGRVVQGMEVVDAIKNTPTHSVSYFDDVPVKDVVIINAKQTK